MEVPLIITILFNLFAVGIGFFIAYLLYGKTRQELAMLSAQLAEKERLLSNTDSEVQGLRLQTTDQTAKIATLEITNEHLREKIEQQTLETEKLQQRLTTEFENIANKILKERSVEFAFSSEQKISALISPLGEKINEFKNQVKQAYDLETRDKAGLTEAIKGLTEVNARMQHETHNLTKALKGDVKQQGNWGEIVLERVLEVSGLIKGQEYTREEVLEGADGSVQRPDVIVHLPDNKHLIIDSKVSLTAYERMVETEDETLYNNHLRDHIQSLKKHVKELSEKKYHHASGLNTPDFVMMFIPIEASFSVAVQTDAKLFSDAWEKKIVIVSPTTLLATLRTVASIWKQENQTKNALEIARLSGVLYDKLAGFVGDWSKVRENIDRAARSYDDAMNKMSEGQGNLFRTADKIRQLGAKTAKELPSHLID